MEEEKKNKTKKEDKDTGFTEFLLKSVLKGIQSSFDGAMERAHQAVHVFTGRLVRRIFLFFFAFLGLGLLLVGLAQLLSTVYRFPGIGETLMGVFVLLVALVLYAFSQDNRSTY